ANRSGRLLVIKPMAIWGSEFPNFNSPNRKLPVLFEMKSTQSDVVRIKIPPRCKVDEPFRDADFTTAFGTFAQTYERNDHQVTIRRRLVLTARLIPADQYKDLKAFFDLAKSESEVGIVFVSE